jgi:hypothetical protein
MSVQLVGMNQTNHFFNLGYGWLCKHCSAEDTERQHNPAQHHSDSKPSGLPLAAWTDPSHHALNCPRCGIEETIIS